MAYPLASIVIRFHSLPPLSKGKRHTSLYSLTERMGGACLVDKSNLKVWPEGRKPDKPSSELIYLHGDHLGSTSLLTYGSSPGNMVAGSETRYLPYGSHRLAPTTQLTERDYTGQKENLELGLLYYKARYYVPGIDRVASADTIVPDPANPQQLNRYAYALNNLIRYFNPSGHCAKNTRSGDEYEEDYTQWATFHPI